MSIPCTVTNTGHTMPPSGGGIITIPPAPPNTFSTQCVIPPGGPGFPGDMPNCTITVDPNDVQNLNGPSGTINVDVPDGMPHGKYMIIVIGPPEPESDYGYLYMGSFNF